jgi:integrase/recombinase XerD
MANNRSGYVFQNKKGAWYARTTITDSNGKRRNVKRRAKDKQDAKRLLKSLLKELDAEGVKAVDFSKLTFDDLAAFYSENYCKPAENVDGKKVSGLRDVFRARYSVARFREYFGNRRLRDITYEDVRSYHASRLKQHTHYNRPPNVATMNRELGVLRRLFNIAVRQGWMSRNPFSTGESLISPASERKRERILTFAEECKLLEACDSSLWPFLRPLIICLLDSGARLSEFLQHLRWRSVCFENRTITLEAMTTKTLKARQVTMTSRMFKELRAIREAAKSEDDRVFKATVRQARFGLLHACKAAGIEYGSPYGITYHSFRHSAAVRLVKGQMPLQMVGRILGHSQPQTTYRYLSADLETTEQAAKIFEAFHTQTSTPVEASEAVN